MLRDKLLAGSQFRFSLLLCFALLCAAFGLLALSKIRCALRNFLWLEAKGESMIMSCLRIQAQGPLRRCAGEGALALKMEVASSPAPAP